MAKKSCKKGYYYCNTDEKCKKIPKGYHIMPTGYLMKDSAHKEEEKEETKKKNGNGANGNGNGNGESSGSSDGGGVSEAKEHGDHEVSMAKSQLKKSAENIAKLRKVLNKKTDKDNLPAWVQAKITDTEHNTDAAAGYMDEANKSGDRSLRDWFTKSRASDGTPGWVQLGGKYAGKPCAKQPGQTTKPKCGSSKMARNLDDKEEESAFRRKNRKDKDPNRKGAPINVATEKKKKLNASYSDWRSELEDLHEIPALIGIPLAVGAGYGLYKAGQHLYKKGNAALDNARQNATFRGNAFGAGARQREIERKAGVKPGTLNPNMQRLRNSYEPEGEIVEQTKPTHTFRQRMGYDMTVPSDVYQGNFELRRSLERRGSDLSRQDRKYFKSAGGYARMQQDNQTMQQVIDRGRKEQERLSSKQVNTANWTDERGRKVYAGNPPMRFDVKNSFDPEGELIDEGKKDACYHKVKSRYKIWPSAYASGALVKCRKVGAKNWGNKTKKEGFSDWREDMLLEGLEDKLRGMSQSQIEDLIKANKGAEKKIRETLARMRSATPRPQGSGPQMPTDFAKQGVSSRPRTTISVADYANRNVPNSAWQKAQQNPSAYRPGPGVRPDFSGVNPRPRPRPVTPRVVRPRTRFGGGRVGLAIGAATAAAPFVFGAIKKLFNKEDYDYSNWRDDFQATEYETVDIIKPEPLQPSQSVIDEGGKKCWKGYKKAGTQKLFGKTYNRCVKEHFSDWRAEMGLQEKKSKPDYLDFDGDGNKKEPMKKALKDKEDVKEDWQKSNRKDGVDGMSQKSVNAYKRENPGSNLQTAVTEKKPKGKRAKRRKSFCARSKGQKDMHNIDCSKTPEKKICKARKRWRC